MSAFRFVLGGLVCITLTSASPVAHAQTTPGVYNICRGEFEALCRRHPFDRFERCGTYGVNGANQNLSCQFLCGKPLGYGCEVVTNAPSTSGNACGYTWFKVTCVGR